VKIDGFQFIFFVLLLMLLVFVYPIVGHFQYRKLMRGLVPKLNFYWTSILDTMIPALLIVGFFALSGRPLREIGLKGLDLRMSGLSRGIIYPTVALYFLYLTYTLYSIILFKFSGKARAKAASALPKNLAFFLPVSRNEKKIWDFVALNAGLTEELIYRGYLLYALPLVFPAISLPLILAASSFIFGIGHFYQGLEALKPLILGLLFGFFYIVFDSLFPVMLVHILQDLVVRDLLEVEGR
jgi:membrane protease YdiL (CAAX protease family)